MKLLDQKPIFRRQELARNRRDNLIGGLCLLLLIVVWFTL